MGILSHLKGLWICSYAMKIECKWMYFFSGSSSPNWWMSSTLLQFYLTMSAWYCTGDSSSGYFFLYIFLKYFDSNSLGRSCQTLPLWVLRSALRRDLRSSSDYWESSNCFASSEYSSLPDISGPWRLWERHVNIDWLSRWLSSLLQSETVTESWGCFSFFSSWGFSSSPLSCMSLRTTWRELTSWRCWTPTGGRWLPWQLWDTATSPPPPSLDGL